MYYQPKQNKMMDQPLTDFPLPVEKMFCKSPYIIYWFLLVSSKLHEFSCSFPETGRFWICVKFLSDKKQLRLSKAAFLCLELRILFMLPFPLLSISSACEWLIFVYRSLCDGGLVLYVTVMMLGHLQCLEQVLRSMGSQHPFARDGGTKFFLFPVWQCDPFYSKIYSSHLP